MLQLTTLSSIERQDFDRLYSEAYDKISHERKRIGDVQLADVMFKELNENFILAYYLNNYLVGVASITKIEFNEQTYAWYRFPLYGKDQTGSRSWWYLEDLQKQGAAWFLTYGCKGIITMFNPGSPASTAVLNHFGSFGKYFEKPVVHDINNINPHWDKVLPGGKAMVIGLKLPLE